MKTTGWVILVLGTLSFLGCLMAGNSPMGPTFWIALGAFLVHRADQKKKEKEEKDKWSKQ